jgi:uncharacterized protein
MDRKKIKREEEILDKVLGILVEHLSPERIILFGSRGKGKFSGNPDFDFAVDTETPDIRTERLVHDEIEKVAGLYKVDVVYLPAVDEDFREIIYETGKVVYERYSIDIS